MGRFLPILVLFFAALLLSSKSSATDLFIGEKGRMFSARVEDFSLKAVAEEIESKTGIWFKSGGALPEEGVSLEFEGLPFEDGLDRIFSKMNSSLIFDDEDEIVGAFLFRSVAPRQKQIISRAKARAQARIAPRPARSRRTMPIRRPGHEPGGANICARLSSRPIL